MRATVAPKKIHLQEKSMRGRTTWPCSAELQIRARGISFPAWGCLTSRNLRAQSARPRDPFGILFNLSLSLYRICTATADGETKSILYPPTLYATRIGRIYFPGAPQRFFSKRAWPSVSPSRKRANSTLSLFRVERCSRLSSSRLSRLVSLEACVISLEEMLRHDKIHDPTSSSM